MRDVGKVLADSRPQHLPVERNQFFENGRAKHIHQVCMERALASGEWSVLQLEKQQEAETIGDVALDVYREARFL
jgi:hypothetical protein